MHYKSNGTILNGASATVDNNGGTWEVGSPRYYYKAPKNIDCDSTAIPSPAEEIRAVASIKKYKLLKTIGKGFYSK